MKAFTFFFSVGELTMAYLSRLYDVSAFIFFDHIGRAKQTNGKEIAPDNVIK
jgi:hypothetical protein